MKHHLTLTDLMNRRLATAALILALNMVAGKTLAAPDSINIQQGMKLYAGHHWEEASEYLQRALKAEPTCLKCHQSLGLCYYHMGELQGALDEIAISHRLDPTAEMPYKVMADIYQAMGRNRDAIKLYNELVVRQPKDLELRYGRAQAYVALLDYDKAIEDYSALITMNPRESKYFRQRAIVFVRMRKFQNAISDYSSCLNLKADLLDALMGRADCFASLNNYKAAISDYSLAIKLNPEKTRGYVARAFAYDKIGRADLANADRKFLKSRGETFD